MASPNATDNKDRMDTGQARIRQKLARPKLSDPRNPNKVRYTGSYYVVNPRN